jgi:hypothetical protein
VNRAMLIGITIGLTFVACMSSDVARALIVGWAQFLWRALPRMTWDRNAFILAGVAFGLFTLGVHWLGRAWLRARGPERRWKFGWSLVVCAAVVVAFAAGICMIGATHQTGWLLASEEPMVVETEAAPRSSWTSTSNLRALAIGLHNYLDSYNYRPPGIGQNGEPARHGWAIQALSR